MTEFHPLQGLPMLLLGLLWATMGGGAAVVARGAFGPSSLPQKEQQDYGLQSRPE
jgi:hypothetical protein